MPSLVQENLIGNRPQPKLMSLNMTPVFDALSRQKSKFKTNSEFHYVSRIEELQGPTIEEQFRELYKDKPPSYINEIINQN